MKKVALVSGANKGIGFEIARGLARAGMRVMLGARDPGRGHAACAALRDQGLDVQHLALDVTDPASIERAVAELEQLDVLVNNAGIASMDIGAIFTTNVFGLAALTRACVPLLEQSKGRVVNLSSSLASLTRVSDAAQPARAGAQRYWQYASSKAAVNALTAIFAAELAPRGIQVNAVCPGYCATDLNGHQGTRTAEQGAQIAIRVALEESGTGRYLDDAGVVPW